MEPANRASRLGAMQNEHEPHRFDDRKEFGMARPRTIAAAALVVAAVALFPTGPAFARTAGRSLPPGFHAQSMSWVSAHHGWIVGNASCDQGTCTTVLRTTDGGATWNQAGTIDAPLTLEQASGV